MTQLRDPQSPSASKPAGPSGEADPLQNLYHMSLTAGLGSGDYVAINNTSIVALILGLTSVLSLLYPIMLLAALAAVVCGVLALVQIRSSNGTQTGRAFAALGILLGLALGGVAAGQMVVRRMDRAKDEAAIDQLVGRLSQLIVAKDYGTAYRELFTDDFKQSFTEQAFAERWETFAPVYGAVKGIDWGHRAEIDIVRGTNEKRAVASSAVSFEKFAEPARQAIMLTARDGEWKFDGIGQLFEKPKDTRGQQQQMPDPTQPLGPELMVPDASAPQGPGPQ